MKRFDRVNHECDDDTFLCVLVFGRLIFDLLPLFVFLPSVPSRLPLSCSRGHIGRSGGDMWHSDICHLLFAPADALYKFTKRLERSRSLLCAFSHIISKGLILVYFEVVFLLWKVSVSACTANRVARRGEETCRQY